MNFSKRILVNIHPTRTVCVRKKSGVPSTAEYCMNLVKQNDYENFASILLLEREARSCAFAVRSFNVEVARIAEQVTEKHIGLMRMKFWEDVLSKCFSKEVSSVPQHPVAIELFKAVEKCKLTKRNFTNLIGCRKDNFNVTSFNNLEDMEKYSEKSVSSVYYLILEGCGIRDVNADHAASHLGKAQGIVQQLRSIPLSRRLNFIPLPQAILVKNNVAHEELLRCQSSQQLNDCVYEVASRAHQHLTKARSLRESVPSKGRSAFLPAIATSIYLNRLQKVDYDIFHPQLKHRQWNLLFQMWLANFRNNY